MGKAFGTDVDDQAVDWLLRVRELQTEGLSFDEALAKANAEVDGQ